MQRIVPGTFSGWDEDRGQGQGQVLGHPQEPDVEVLLRRRERDVLAPPVRQDGDRRVGDVVQGVIVGHAAR
ncbi:hypothetical protein OHO83_11750 [Streptomyces sp. NBC_00569]|uniref:hypothetical protein n=1 Tax=Streptomyces sp. NBC_00569 TaxID=2975780 RepID=UPI002E802FFF|nr:hypothetical protein [Streptomyces sp. NBC_00569]WUB92908.1 hypothetical protein OHO83_11750 [Streptomyces sp. NBC_00569]